MKPITREEYYLAKIAGTWQGKTPEPVTIEEYYLATMAGDYSGNTPQPVTRLQYYMAKAAGVWGGSIPAPVTRLEYYWAAIAGKEGHIPDPVTRQEYLLYAISQSNNDVINTVFGATIIINDAAEGRPFRGLRVFGKSTQDGTPSVENPVPIVNVGESGSIKVGVLGKNLVNIADFVVETINSGTGFAYAPDDLTNQIKALPNGTYSISYEFDGDEIRPKPNRKITFHDSLNNMLIDINNVFVLTDDLRSKIAKTIVYGTKGTNITFRNIILVNGSTIPMIYSPYRDPQTLTLATPNGLPGIPVTTDGNYTDADGQQWVCDEIDLERGKYVQRVLKTKPNKTIVFTDRNENGRCAMFDNSLFGTKWMDGSKQALSSIAQWSEWGNRADGTFALAANGIYYKDSMKTLEEMNAMFAKIGTDFEVCGVLATPIERDLTPEEITAYKALRTYGPTTVITNDAGTGMEVTYVAER